jgi:putative endonuclease
VKPIGTHNYFIYITTNLTKTTLYIGVTNNLETRLHQHAQNQGNADTFAGKYHCYHLVYFERFEFIEHAIKREKEIKKWRREKKNNLITSFNSEWRFLNNEIK